HLGVQTKTSPSLDEGFRCGYLASSGSGGLEGANVPDFSHPQTGEVLMSRRFGMSCLVLALGARMLASAVPAHAQKPASAPDVTAAPADAEERRERVTMERFLALLEKSPRRGTALDRVYGYHVERGTLDAFIKGYDDRVARAPGDGDGWLLL